jgi:hypothetical protein
MNSDLVEVDRHVAWSAEDLTYSVGRRILHEPWVRHPARECLEGSVDFQPGERTADADVNAASPADMLVVFAFRVEGVGVGEAAWVAIGRAVHQEDG